MPIAVADLEAEIIRRGLFGRVLALAGLDGQTQDGTNRDLRARLRQSLGEVGYQAADGITLVDADVSSLIAPAVERVLLRARRLLIDDVLMNWDRVEQSFEADLEGLKRFEDRLKWLIRDLDAQLSVAYSISGASGFEFGTIQDGDRLPRHPTFADILPSGYPYC